MNRSRNIWLVLIIFGTVFSLWVDFSQKIEVPNPFNQATPFLNRDVSIKEGLDLRGGLQTLLEADVPADRVVTTDEINNTRSILENRANALGVSEVVMQTAGNRRIVAEFPGVSNPEQVVAALKQTALLEFVDMGDTPAKDGTRVTTDMDASQAAAGETIYHTVMTGAGLNPSGIAVGRDPARGYAISFTLKTDAAKAFGDYTTANVNKYMAVVLDKVVQSVATIKQPITGGQVQISGSFTQETANTLAIQLRSGSLPVPVKVVESRTVGPTLGEESVRKSVLAGAIGLTVVILFMGLNYRLPGIIADLALVVYALLSLMLFKLIPVTLTLPGIAGFILSIGMAVDANVLIFERLKEELRAGRTLVQAIDLGWTRAFPSIRDSNISTLITCVILYGFGNTFGASMVKGFSVTLALGVLVSLFTAIIVTRTFLHTALDGLKIGEHPTWFGL